MSTHGPFVLLGCILALCAGCASVSRDQALSTAKGELTRRHCLLPPNYTVLVGEGVFQAEFGSPRPLWEVEFSAQTRHGKTPLYVVLINRRSGAVDMFSDISRTVPSRF
jgi:hypothetical protein